MKKRALSALLFLCILSAGLASGCTPKEQIPGFLNPGEILVKLANPLDLGVVQIVTSLPYSGPDEPAFDYKAQERILKLVEDTISRDRNIRMKFEPVYADDSTGTAELVAKLTGAGDPPEIVGAADTLGSRQPPLVLNDAIAKYGPNLAKIPALQMEPCRIGGSVMSLPVESEQFFTVPVLNRKIMDQHGWQEPKTLEDLAALLQLAKDAGIQPIIGLPTGMVNLLLPEAAQPGYACRQEDGTVLPLWRSEIFRQTVDFVKEWQDAGYFADRRMMADTDYLLQPNWLLSYARASAATLPGVDLLPLTLQGQQGIAFGGMNTVSGRAFKYACDKPEALVTLMDWTLAKTENNSLMQFGQEDKDYKLVDENTVRRLVERYDWVTQSFAASWLYPLPMEDCANPGLVTEINEAVSKAQELRSSQGRGLVSLPQNTKRFAKPGSELANAWECVPDACGVIAEVRFIDGLDWQEMEQPDGTKPIRVVRFQSLQEYDAEAAPYLKLLQAWLDGGYNPLADMVAAGAK